MSLCGVLQLLLFLGYSYLAAKIFELGFLWISAGGSLIDWLPAVGRGSAPPPSHLCRPCR